MSKRWAWAVVLGAVAAGGPVRAGEADPGGPAVVPVVARTAPAGGGPVCDPCQLKGKHLPRGRIADSNEGKTLRDFFRRVKGERLACDPCK